jgi:hypothetical protein
MEQVKILLLFNMINKGPKKASKYRCISALVQPHIVIVTIYSPYPVLLSRLWTAIQQAHIELPEDGALKRRNM